MKLSKSTLARVFSGLLVMGGMAAASSASAQTNDGYDNTAQLLTGLTIGAVAGYALLQAADGMQDVHYKGHHKGHRGHGYHQHHRGCGHDRGHYYSYKKERHYGYDRGHHRGHYKEHGRGKDRWHNDHRGHRDKYDRHDRGMYRIKEESYSRRGGYERRVSVTHF